MRMVSLRDWNLSELPDDARRHRLLSPPSAECVLTRLISEAAHAAECGEISLNWQRACEKPGYFRLHAQIPVSECKFDELFNGRSGYRAQYYLSPEEGILYNRKIIKGLIPAIRAAFDRKPLQATFDLIALSLVTPHSKIWIFSEKEAFNSAAENTLNPPRWVQCHATIGRKCPLPASPKIDLKGSFIKPGTMKFFVDELKADRAGDLHRKGFS